MGCKVDRVFTAERVNEIINHPAVFPWVAGPDDNYLDASDFTADRKNITLLGEHGAILCAKKDNDTYDVHTQILPEGRQQSLDFCRAVANYLFLQTSCKNITTSVPVDNTAAMRLTLAMGFEKTLDGDMWTYHDGKRSPMILFELKKDRWKSCQQQQ